MTRRLLVIGVGPGDPDQLTIEAVRAMNEASAFVITEKDRPDGDALAAARTALLARHVHGEPRVIVVEDPERDRTEASTADVTGYENAVSAWHATREDRYLDAVQSLMGDVGFLVWGDPALYDSTIRVLQPVAERVGARLDVIPGVSSLSALAARHRIVLHRIGEPLHITTGRRLDEAIATGQTSIAVMLNRSLDELAVLDADRWTIWWGANLGLASERLVAGRLGDVLDEIQIARSGAREQAGWVMDAYLLQRD